MRNGPPAESRSTQSQYRDSTSLGRRPVSAAASDVHQVSFPAIQASLITIRGLTGAADHVTFRHGADTVEVREDAAERFNSDHDERLQGTVWNTGCASRYLDETGRNATLWPDWTWRFRQRTASFDPADFELTQRTAGPAEAGCARRCANCCRGYGTGARSPA